MATNAVDRKTIDAMNEQVRQQVAQEEEEKRLMKEARKAARRLRRSKKKAEKATALRAARQTGYSGTIIMLNGKPYEVVYQSRPSQVVQIGNLAPPSFNTAPQFTKQTMNGIPVIRIYRGFRGELYAVGRMSPGETGLVWGRGYDPTTGIWKGGDYNLTAKQVEELSYGMECIINNGALGTTVKKSSTVKKGSTKGKGKTAPPKKTKTSADRKPNGKGKTRSTAVGGRNKPSKTAGIKNSTVKETSSRCSKSSTGKC